MKDNPKNGHTYAGFKEEDEEEELLTDEIDHAIVMHRDAHFGGSFPEMIAYYQKEGVGVQPEFELERIEDLAQAEEELGSNLSETLLEEEERQAVRRSLALYARLKSLEEEKSGGGQLIADLVLTEEELPEGIFAALVDFGPTLVPALIELVRREEFYDPLFPGYGFAPFLGAIALGKMGDPRAVVPLFEMLGREMCFEEGVILEALEQLGEPARRFLLERVRGRPLTQETVHAAFALSAFTDSEVARTAIEQLEDPEVQRRPLLALYLVSICSFSEEEELQLRFKRLLTSAHFGPEVRQEMERVVKDWE